MSMNGTETTSTPMCCVGCGDAHGAAVRVTWSMSKKPQTGVFCRGCAQEFQRRYPQTVATFAPVGEQETPCP